MNIVLRWTRRAAVCSLLFACTLNAQVQVKYDLTDPDQSPFPSNRFTQVDWSQKTYRRVALPLPNCTQRPSDCADISILNSLDGFNVQPRISVPFSGPIDLTSVNSNTIYLVNLGDTATLQGFGQRVGINQVVWDAATNTLAFEANNLLAEHSRYMLVVTNGVKDTTGVPIATSPFWAFQNRAIDWEQCRNMMSYCAELGAAVLAVRTAPYKLASAAVFTTQSTTSDLEKIRQRIKRTAVAPVNFMLGNSGSVRTVFPVASIAGMMFHRQVGTAPAFAPTPVPTPALQVAPGAVGTIAYGSFASPSYLNADGIIPQVPSLQTPAVRGSEEITFQLFLPSGPKPAGGWPVAVFGPGTGGSLYDMPWPVASLLASKGIAMVSIHTVGHGGGPLGTLQVQRTDGSSVSLASGGRGLDRNADGVIEPTEGWMPTPRFILNVNRDSLRQTTVDLMQLIRQIEGGVDVDADGAADLNAQRIYYFGHSLGGIYGTLLLAIEPNIKAGVPANAGGSMVDVARNGVFRSLAGTLLAMRIPSLSNVPDPSGIAFNENLPLRNQPTVINTVPGAWEIQKTLDRFEWAQQSANPVAYAPYLRKQPLPGNTAKPVLFQIGKGDRVVPNPSSTAIIRAGDLADRATYLRYDLVYATQPGLDNDPHQLLLRVDNPALAPLAVGLQSQIAAFFLSNGALMLDPDGANPVFEVPLSGPLPEGLNFLP